MLAVGNIGGIGRLGLTAAAVRAMFDPRSLFAAGEQGLWYDNADFSTLYQDSAGTTPVTAPGQPVGLQLDKSRGLVLGPELVTNGGFDSGTAGWSTSFGGISGGVYSYSGANIGGGNNLVMQAGLALAAGKTYEIGYEVKLLTGSVSLRIATATADIAVSSVVSAPGVYRQIITLSGAADRISAVARGGGLTVVEFDNISVRELPGAHRFQATATARPLYQSGPHRLAFDGIDDVHNVNFPASLGSNCTIARAVPGVGASILTGQTIGASLAITQSDAGLIIVNRPFTASETASVTAYLNARAFA